MTLKDAVNVRNMLWLHFNTMWVVWQNTELTEMKCYYYTAEYIAHMTGGARTAVYVLKSRQVLDTFTSQLCRVSVCVEANFN